MRLASAVIFLVFICLTFPAAHAAGKVTADPNATGARSEASATETSDTRLDTKLTYEGGYKRLHDVISELSKATGVAIGCGTNQSDWRVRDIPIVVFAKDLPLGRVLTALADSAHVDLASEKPEAGKPVTDRTYRVFRTRRGQKEIDSPAEERLTAGLKLAEWSWDALVAFGRMFDAPLPAAAPGNEIGMDPRQIRLIGQILASLGPEGRARAFSGEPIKLRTKDSPQSALLTELCPLACEEFKKQYERLTKQSVVGMASGEQHAEDSFLAIHIQQAKYDGYVGFNLMFGGFPQVRFTTPGSNITSIECGPWLGNGIDQAKVLATVRGLNLPPRPPDPAPLELTEAPPGAGMRALKTDEDWKAPLLQDKVKLELGNDKNKIAFSDVLIALSKTTGLNIICEDFKSQKTNGHAHISLDFPPEATVADVLRKLDDTTWFFSERDKLLLGRAKSWRWYHASLVPEDLLARLRKKLNGPGVELDDCLEVMRLSVSQRDSWIDWSREFPQVDADPSTEDRPLWKLYDALNDDQKKIAASETGLPLASLGPGRASDFMQQEYRNATKGSVRMSADEDPVLEKTKLIFHDRDAIAGSVLRLRVQPMAESGAMSFVFSRPGTKSDLKAPKVDASSKRRYWLELRSKSGEQTIALDACLPRAFPILSLAKEPRWITPSCGGTGFSVSSNFNYPAVIEMKASTKSVIISP